jgi:hypothetical protein
MSDSGDAPMDGRAARVDNALPAGVTTLIYELLDAHDDTARLAGGLGDLAWELHLDYLRALQRRGRELLARAALQEARGG